MLLATVLLVAGVIKIVEPRYVAAALRRVSSAIARRAARSERLAFRAGRAVGLLETVVGLALAVVTGAPTIVVAAVAAMLFGSFLVVVILAVRRGVACGCWASLSEGPAGGAEVGRAVALVGVALVLLSVRIAGRREPEWGRETLVALGVTLAGVVVLTWLGRLVLPVRDSKVADRLQHRAPASPWGRAAMYLAFLFGFVHAGTTAGQRRYLQYLGSLRVPDRAKGV